MRETLKGERKRKVGGAGERGGSVGGGGGGDCVSCGNCSGARVQRCARSVCVNPLARMPQSQAGGSGLQTRFRRSNSGAALARFRGLLSYHGRRRAWTDVDKER